MKGPHLTVLRAYTWLCALESLLAGLGVPFGVIWVEARSVSQVQVKCLAHCTIPPAPSLQDFLGRVPAAFGNYSKFWVHYGSTQETICGGDHMWCEGLKQSQLHGRQVPLKSCTILPSLESSFQHIKQKRDAWEFPSLSLQILFNTHFLHTLHGHVC